MRVSWKLVSILLLTAGLLFACGDDEEAVSEPEESTTTEEEAVEPDEEEAIEEKEGNQDEDMTHEEEDTDQVEVEATEDEDGLPEAETEDQELKLGETGIFEDAFEGAVEITPYAVRMEDEIQGETTEGKWVTINTTIKNISDKTVEPSRLPTPSLFYEDDVWDENYADAYTETHFTGGLTEIDVNELQYYYEGELEPGETAELELLFPVTMPESSFFELVYGSPSRTVDLEEMNNVWWEIDPSDIE